MDFFKFLPGYEYDGIILILSDNVKLARWIDTIINI